MHRVSIWAVSKVYQLLSRLNQERKANSLTDQPARAVRPTRCKKVSTLRKVILTTFSQGQRCRFHEQRHLLRQGCYGTPVGICLSDAYGLPGPKNRRRERQHSQRLSIG